MNLNSLNVITGFTGFIGSHLRISLMEGGGTALLCQRNGTFIYSSPRGENHYSSLKEAMTDVGGYESFTLFHCATKFEKFNNPDSVEDLVQANFRYPTNLIKELLDYGDLHLINLNSFWQAIGGSIGHASSNYAMSKNLFYFNVHQILDQKSVTNLFLHDTYGPRDQREKLIPTLLKHIGSSQVLNLSSPNKAINLLYISDVVEGIKLAGVHRNPGNFELRSPTDSSLGEVVDILQGILGSKINIQWNLDGIVPTSNYEGAFAGQPDFWLPRVSLESGLGRLVDQIFYNSRTYEQPT